MSASPSGVAFFEGLNDNNQLIDPADEFPAQIEAVYMGFDYTGLPASGEIGLHIDDHGLGKR